ncbi:MAG: pilus assembly PilX N-terminal domain-containing protein [Deltaproteobacteria bacterium]|nr:pilus assembly PilX N-terminal domain-containing protein [Deltaproteobacteria bacterium]
MRVFNNHGVSIVGAAVTLALLSLFALVINYSLTFNANLVQNLVQYHQAFYVAQAGFEYALKKVGSGQSSVVASPGLTVGSGQFTISQSNNLLTITGTVGNRVSQQTMQIVTQANCAELETEDANWKNGSNIIQHLTLEKECGQLDQIILDKVILEWSGAQPSEGTTKIKVENTNNLYSSPQLSETILDVIDELIGGNSHAVFNEIQFNSNLRGRTFTITVVMGDQSFLVTTFTPL